MRENLLNEIIQLKEEKKILEAACGKSDIDRHIFTHDEKARMKSLCDDDRSVEMLKDTERRLWEDEIELREQHR